MGQESSLYICSKSNFTLPGDHRLELDFKGIMVLICTSILINSFG
jgi:hypothetical protein